MATITVQEQLDILSESKTIPTCLHADGMFNAIIFATPKIDMSVCYRHQRKAMGTY